jgi:Family of unknown function (DUF6521)
MNIAHDIYAETNPAYCAFVLSSFVAAYRSVAEKNVPVAAAYLALPIALSDDLSNSFIGTNKKTGLNVWIDRNPEIVFGLAERVNLTLLITEEAVKFGCFNRIITLENDACLSQGDSKLKKNTLASLDASIQRTFKRSEVIGHWFASAGTLRTVINTLGLSI